MNLDELKRSCNGAVYTPSDEGFEYALHRGLWNQLLPGRSPEVIAQITSEDDISAVIRFAKAQGLKVTVRGGGHHWCQPTLRQGGVLIDISALAGVISIDEAAKRAVIRPLVSNREIQQALNPLGLAFASGHCPQVKASGYLLSGGMAWNPTVWGFGVDNVEAIELVNAEGTKLRASETENADYFWAARGAGPGFFGVVTKFYLKLYTLPKAIRASTYYYRLADAPSIGKWLGQIAPTMSPSVELSQFVVQAPAELQAEVKADDGWLTMVTGVAFEETQSAAEEVLTPLDGAPQPTLSREFAQPRTFEQLFDASGALWPEEMRSRVEAVFSNACPGDILSELLEQMQRAPSLESLFLFTIFCGPEGLQSRSSMAHSMSGRVYGGPWTMWRTSAEDEVNAHWHHELLERLRPYCAGYYIGESHFVERPENVEESYTPDRWKRLCELRAKYDPEGLFFSPFEGFEEV